MNAGSPPQAEKLIEIFSKILAVKL